MATMALLRWLNESEKDVECSRLVKLKVSGMLLLVKSSFYGSLTLTFSIQIQI